LGTFCRRSGKLVTGNNYYWAWLATFVLSGSGSGWTVKFTIRYIPNQFKFHYRKSGEKQCRFLRARWPSSCMDTLSATQPTVSKHWRELKSNDPSQWKSPTGLILSSSTTALLSCGKRRCCLYANVSTPLTNANNTDVWMFQQSTYASLSFQLLMIYSTT